MLPQVVEGNAEVGISPSSKIMLLPLTAGVFSSLYILMTI
jgi:hypothetical protein